MRKFYIAFQLIFTVGVVSGQAQSLYKLNDTYIDLETFTKADASATSDSVALAEKDFKKKSRFAARFNVVDLMGEIPPVVYYMDRPFRVIDDNHIGYKVTPGSKEIKLQTNSEEESIEKLPGSHFVLGLSDGILNVQRFEGKLGYRVSKFDEWGKLKFKQNVQHTLYIDKDGSDFAVPYLSYFAHTDRFMVFTSLNTRTVHKTVVMDLKDGKLNNIESTVCGVIRAENELSFKGYMLRDETAKTLKFSIAGSMWAIKEPNITKVVGETLLNDSLIIFARYYKGTPTVSLAACNAKTGKVVWVGQVKQPAGAPDILYMSAYKNKLLLEGVIPGKNFLEAFDINTGKTLYCSLD